MNAMGGGVGGPAGGQQMMNTGTPSSAPNGGQSLEAAHRTRLHTYIYEYFLRNGMFDLARSLVGQVEIEQASAQKQSPNRKDVNGGPDAMDQDMKADIPNKPDDLPDPAVPNLSDSSFLFDWWVQFWDCFQAQRHKGSMATTYYLGQVQKNARISAERQRQMITPQMQGNMMRTGMMPNGMPMNADMKKFAAMQGQQGRPSPQQIQQMRQQQMMMQHQAQQNQMMQQNQMQREGSTMDGQQRPQTPGSGEHAPSPKRQRLDGSFNGQMGPMGRGQPQGMNGQQFNTLSMQTPAVQQKSMQVYADSMRQQMLSAMGSDAQKGMPPNGFPQGSPEMDPSGQMSNANQMRGVPGAGPGGAPGSNHALQDYQMQLMLLEQQNKKRLLMARQEQDNAPAVQVNQMSAQFAPQMSPSNSRTGPSPNPDDMRRGTPKMAPGGMPPGPDGMPQGRGSPAPGFDPSQMNPNMPHGMFQQMAKMNQMNMAPNGQMMPANAHPAMMNGQQMTPQQMEFIRQQQQQAQMNGQRPAGPFPPGPPNMMPGGQPQQPPNMTPQQRNAAMPPPPAPATGDNQNRTQPSSPSQTNAAPPTPSQANKPNPKGKKDAPKAKGKAANKKGGATAATPASEGGEQPQTPTPAPPITPTAPPQQFKNGDQGPNQGQPSANPAMGGQPGQPDMSNGPFGAIDGSDNMNNINLDFGNLDAGEDVLGNFDFEAFLQDNNGTDGFNFDSGFNFGDTGLEAGADM